MKKEYEALTSYQQTSFWKAIQIGTPPEDALKQAKEARRPRARLFKNAEAHLAKSQEMQAKYAGMIDLEGH